MNAKQMAILTAAVVALVVIVTLVKVGLGGHDGGGQGQKIDLPVLPDPHLTFKATGGPTSRFSPQLPPDQEMGVEGHHDFQFTNDKDAPVDVFVTRVSCNRCLRVQIGLTPDSGKVEDVAWEALETEEVKANAHGFTVPPKRGGWVRLTWKDEEAGAKLLTADLRTTSSIGSAPTIPIQYGALFVERVRVLPEKKEMSVETLHSGYGPRTAWFTVYSSTRPDFTLEAEKEEVQKRHPFVTCGTPEPLTDEQCRALEKEHKRAFLCGYRVPVTVWERLKDGREHDLGPFRTGVALKCSLLDEDLGLYVLGTVHSDGVKVVGDENVEDRVIFGNFRRDIDAVKTVRLETKQGTTLRIDKKPDFMEAELKDESDGAGKLWGLTLTIRANGVSGHFPRPDDPGMSDTAIYLKANERPLRIPVSGTASQR
jgi:hypothetical protein